MTKRTLLKLAIGFGVFIALGLASWWALLRPPVYIRLVLTLVEQQSVMRDTVDWPHIRNEVFEMAADAETPADTHPAIQHLIRRLNDGHSFLISASESRGVYQNYGLLTIRPENVVVQVIQGSGAWERGIRERDVIELVNGAQPTGEYWIDMPSNPVSLTVRSAETNELNEIEVEARELDMLVLPTGRMLHGGVGYLNVPSALPIQSDYSETLLGLIREFEGQGARAWIVDLRRNSGGTMWHMLNGLRPLVGEGALGYFERPGSSSAGFRDNVLSVLSMGMLARPGSREPWVLDGEPKFRLRNPDPQIAVLMSRMTGSSGEMTAIAFRGLERARSFGEETAGFTTSNSVFPLPDGSFLALTTAYCADRNGITIQDNVTPDEPVPIDWTRLGKDDDPVIQAARTWFSSEQ